MAARWPAGWRVAPRAGTQRARGLAARRITPVRVERFTRAVTGVPLSGGNAQAPVGAGGAVTVSVGPQGWGTVWHPTAAILSTSTGALDTSTAAVYLGSQALQNLQGGQSYNGGGDVVSLISDMTPGDLLIVVWAGAVPGAVAALNIQGTMDVVAY
jgi:hypothetical protein